MMESTERKELIKRMRDKGLTYQLIGEILGISKQRAYQIGSGYKPSAEARRRYRAAHPEQVRAECQRYAETHREVLRERARVSYARKKQEAGQCPKNTKR